VRSEELARLTDTAREIWAALMQESTVNLGKIELKGTSTRRRVELRADVDGAGVRALGVMSQGELHALAMALFLPRGHAGQPVQLAGVLVPVASVVAARALGSSTMGTGGVTVSGAGPAMVCRWCRIR
jgi:hypothetical protein